jgi:hypothetical protein
MTMNKLGLLIMIASMLSVCTFSKEPAGEARLSSAEPDAEPSPWDPGPRHLVTVDGRAEGARPGAPLLA